MQAPSSRFPGPRSQSETRRGHGPEPGPGRPHSSPQLAQHLVELGVVQVRVLVSQFEARCLCPHHERVHGPLQVRLGFERATTHQAPVVALESLRHGVADAVREALVCLLRLVPGTLHPPPARSRPSERAGEGGALESQFSTWDMELAVLDGLQGGWAWVSLMSSIGAARGGGRTGDAHRGRRPGLRCGRSRTRNRHAVNLPATAAWLQLPDPQQVSLSGGPAASLLARLPIGGACPHLPRGGARPLPPPTHKESSAALAAPAAGLPSAAPGGPSASRLELRSPEPREGKLGREAGGSPAPYLL
ncbi:PREDICTED: uncharacterized protein LOC108523282 [Rhinopithecus bieti]|uniref:uncharacterized protein LOC108523282 n=1 Tax=Rhinopithecus bieti TaxID=61621 RepID=UPI00083C67EF|nr:PREDICTED: uncharacterized protein LOC108523282 [Rhinopithecus bieti]XP_017719297.1 PREDICTED: uncharacterized protein LOC108523282 [Rhinopithecus bieti]XP_017719298.1 PREDICTED: uncharacterized protein LOC108523282 [Rhinopithecus bieti]